MLAIRRNPANGALARWTRDVDDLFEQMCSAGPTAFRVNVHEDEGNLTFEAELPGLSKDQIDISVENNVLTISGAYKQETAENRQYHVYERRQGEFSRSFRLPQMADTENVEATLTNGVLSLRVPKREEAKTRRIEVK